MDDLQVLGSAPRLRHRWARRECRQEWHQGWRQGWRRARLQVHRLRRVRESLHSVARRRVVHRFLPRPRRLLRARWHLKEFRIRRRRKPDRPKRGRQDTVAVTVVAAATPPPATRRNNSPKRPAIRRLRVPPRPRRFPVLVALLLLQRVPRST